MSNWNEQDHPRVPGGDINGGQFTSKQVGTAARAASAAANVGVPEHVLLNRAVAISRLQYERFYAWDPVTGKQTQDLRGTRDRVEKTIDLTPNDMANSITMHNHPSGNRSAMFSDNDLAMFEYWNTAENWVVAGDFVMVIKRPKAGWPSFLSSRLTGALVEELVKVSGAFGVQLFQNAYGTSIPEMRDAVVRSYQSIGAEAYWFQHRRGKE